MNYALVGYGRMGRAVEETASRRGHHRVALVDPSAGERGAIARIERRALRGAEVAFEFTEPGAAEANVIALLGAGLAVVCGTTGWGGPGAAVREAVRASGRGVVFAPNFSVGMGLFGSIVEDAARRFARLGSYDPFLVEFHHRGKKDAPSGTALDLARRIAEAGAPGTPVALGTPAEPIARGAVHVVSVRAGHESGVHTVGFDGESDVVTLTHRARGRSAMALGAVLAGEWIRGRRGVSSFERVLEDLVRRGGRREPKRV